MSCKNLVRNAGQHVPKHESKTDDDVVGAKGYVCQSWLNTQKRNVWVPWEALMASATLLDPKISDKEAYPPESKASMCVPQS